MTPEGARWGWLAVAAGAGALGLLALWVLRERDESPNEENPAGEVDIDELQGPVETD